MVSYNGASEQTMGEKSKKPEIEGGGMPHGMYSNPFPHLAGRLQGGCFVRKKGGKSTQRWRLFLVIRLRIYDTPHITNQKSDEIIYYIYTNQQ